MLRLGLPIVIVVFVFDQLSKFWILNVLKFSPPGCLEYHLGCERMEILPIFKLSMVWNYGVSFGMLRADQGIWRWALVLLSLAIAAVFAGWLRTTKSLWTAVALGLVIGGALGNVVDRIRFGAVADFLDFGPLFPWVFNVADAGITVGAVLLGVQFLFNPAAK